MVIFRQDPGMGVASRERDRIRSPGRTAGPRAEPSRARCCRSRAGAGRAGRAGRPRAVVSGIAAESWGQCVEMGCKGIVADCSPVTFCAVIPSPILTKPPAIVPAPAKLLGTAPLPHPHRPGFPGRRLCSQGMAGPQHRPGASAVMGRHASAAA